mmetsp:Transcript_4016/g.11714  ORF Transcript_4016/g.11714 Transcript_4016/m.11714 type:complete len:237 (-) Transcript_4016:19-729(-)
MALGVGFGFGLALALAAPALAEDDHAKFVEATAIHPVYIMALVLVCTSLCCGGLYFVNRWRNDIGGEAEDDEEAPRKRQHKRSFLPKRKYAPVSLNSPKSPTGIALTPWSAESPDAAPMPPLTPPSSSAARRSSGLPPLSPRRKAGTPKKPNLGIGGRMAATTLMESSDSEGESNPIPKPKPQPNPKPRLNLKLNPNAIITVHNPTFLDPNLNPNPNPSPTRRGNPNPNPNPPNRA